MPESNNAEKERHELDILLRGFQVSRMLRLVADLGVADKIALDETIAAGALAGACDVQAQPLVRVLRALAAFGVFQVTADGRVAHTAHSRLLRSDIPNSMHHAARFWTAPGAWAVWGSLDSAMTGGVPQEAAWNMSRFEYLRTHPDEARGFDAMMANFPDNRHAAIAEAYDFSGVATIADIGGGNGEALRHILPHFPDARGLLFDRDDVVRAVPETELMDGRITVADGNFLKAVPPGADIYLLIRVLHNWPDEDCRLILGACRAAMKSRSVLLICDQILEPNPAHGHPTEYLMDAQMMAMFGSARERTEDEFATMLSETGFTLKRVIVTRSPVQIVEASPS